MSRLPEALEPVLRDLIHAMQQGLADAESKSPLPVVSRRFEQSGVHVYYRCVCGPAAGAKYAVSGLPSQQLQTLRRAAVVADIGLAEHWQGRGFCKALVRRLCEPQQGIDLIEVENVANHRLAEHLAGAGWLSRNKVEIGGCWVLAPRYRSSILDHDEEH